MFKKLFGKSGTSKYDVVFAVATAVMATWKAVDTYKEYQTEKDQENEQ